MADVFRESILPLAIVDNIAFSKSEAWAWYRIPGDPYDFLSVDQKIQYGLSMSGAFVALMGDRVEPLNIHVISTVVPVNINAWEVQMRSIANERKMAVGFEDFINRQVNYLRSQEFMTRASYIGICLGKRGALNFNNLNPFEVGFKAAIEFIKEWGSKMLQTPSAKIDTFEEQNFKMKESEFFRVLSTGAMAAVRCSADEILLNLIKKPFYPAMPAPQLQGDYEHRLGPGDIIFETGSVIEKNHRYLKMSQMLGSEELEGYTATLVYEKFPSQMVYPSAFPFLTFPSKLGAPFTVHAHCKLVPSEKMKKEVEKKRKEARDELKNMAGTTSADGAVGSEVSAEVSQNLSDLEDISQMLAQDNAPWVYGNYRIVLEAPTLELLNDFTSLLQQAYGDMDIKLRLSAGNQLRLLQEQFPTSNLQVKPFQQITSLSMLSTSGFAISNQVGDHIFGEL